MGNTYKDKDKKLTGPVLKSGHKALRQATNKLLYQTDSEENEDIDFIFKPTEEEQKDYQEYLNSQDDWDDSH